MQVREIFLLVLTPSAWASEWVQKELNLALVTHRQVVPVLHQETPDVRGFLLGYQWMRVLEFSGSEAAQQVLSARTERTTIAPAPVMPVSAPRSTPTLSPLGPAPTPTGSTAAHHLTSMPLYTLGFRGYTINSVECILPPICLVPGGIFIMGSDRTHDPEAYGYETPQDPIEVGRFNIGQYPVTVAEYSCAVRAKAVREAPKAVHGPPDAAGVTWQQQLERTTHPVVCVSWQDAVAYVRWLAETSGGQPWRLPTEAEWEKAARWDAQGQVSRRHPWGDICDQKCCNTSEYGIETTTPVGAYVNGASPYSAQDMAGNVWEWASSLIKPYPYVSGDGREDIDSTENRAMRGGSWVANSLLACAAFRGDRSIRPNFYRRGWGSRLALAASAAS